MVDFILCNSDENSCEVKGKNICRETAIPHDTGIIIAAPGSQAGLDAAHTIEKKFQSTGHSVKILQNPGPDILFHCKQPVIILGNLSNSRCVEYLYYKNLCMTDLSYPGEKGYNLRTIIDPFATGYNVLHIGYSDDTGLLKGVSSFLSKVANPLPYINEVYYTKLPYSKNYLEKLKRETLPEKIDLIPSVHTSLWHYTGLLSYVTGDMESFDTYLEGWRKMIEISKVNSFLIKATHLYMTAHIEIWRLLEFSGMIPDDIRLQIEKCIFDWVESKEGKGYASLHGKHKNLPCHNHTMFCALSLIYTHDYFSKRYPELDMVQEWKSVADDVFYTFNHNGWKPYCDDSSYSNQVSLRLVISYSIFEDNHTFLNTSAKEAGKWIKAIIGQNYMVPSYGDGSVKSPFPVFLSAVFSHYLKDGEMRLLYDRFKKIHCDYESGIQRLFDSGVEPVQPDKALGITLIPLDKYIYDVWSKNPTEAKRLTPTPPTGPYEACFDKVSIRTGWDDKNDDFLLIDGLGSTGVHSYSDAMGVLDYTSKGIVWLVEENDYRWPEPENCSILTIARDGYASEIPGYALMEEQKVLNEGCYYLRIRLKNYNGTDWVREVFMVKGLCVVFHDTVIAEESGEYVIGAHFRTPAKATIFENTLKSVRYDRDGNRFELRLSGYGSAAVNINLEEIPYGERLFNYGGMYDKKENHNGNNTEVANTMWKSRYNDEDMVVSSMTTVSLTRMEKGDKISFTHVVHPAKENEEDITLQTIDNTLKLSYAGKEYIFHVSHTGNIKRENKKEEKGNHIVKTDLRKQFELDKKILHINQTGKNRFVCATEGGTLNLVDNGKAVWTTGLDGDIHALQYIDTKGMIVVGHGHDKLSAIDKNGDILWETRIKRIPTLYYSWELAYPHIVGIKYVESKGNAYIITGAGDNHIRIHNIDGELLNAFYIYATVPDTIEIIDVDQDGEMEVLAAGKVDSAYGIFYVHDMHGNPKNNISTGWWLCNIKSHQFVYEDGKYLMVCGMSYSSNFKVVSLKDGIVKTEFEKNLGGTVKSVLFNESRTKLYAGTSKGSVMAFNREGKQIWHASVKDNVKDLYISNENVISVCESGKVCVISPEGFVISEGRLPGTHVHSMSTGENILVVCDNAVYQI